MFQGMDYVYEVYIAELKKQQPSITVDLFEINSPSIQEELMKETIDLAIECCHLNTQYFENHVIGKENIILAVPKVEMYLVFLCSSYHFPKCIFCFAVYSTCSNSTVSSVG